MAMPTDNGKEFFVKDFYSRTLKILSEYKGEHEVTMLLNAMMGLLVVPKEAYFRSRSVPDIFVDPALLQQMRAEFKHEPNATLTEILRFLRNAVAHGNMTIKAEKPNIDGEQIVIGSVEFRDLNKSVVELKIDFLKRFLIDFATKVCDKKGKK